MNNIIAILIAAFIGAGFLGSASAQLERGPTIGSCENPPMTTIVIVYKKGEISVNPPTAKTNLGKLLRFIVAGEGDSTVTVSGKNPDDKWIEGTAEKGAEMFYVCVDPDLQIPDREEGKVFEYHIEVPGVGYLDPEVIVRR